MCNFTPINGVLPTAASAFYHNHQWANVSTLVGWAKRMLALCRRRRWVKEELSLLVVLCCDSGNCTVGVYLDLCSSMWKSLTGPRLLWLLWKDPEPSTGESWLERPLPSPPPVLLAARSRQRCSAAPTLLFSLCQGLRMESGREDRSSVMILQQQEPAGLKTDPVMALLVWVGQRTDCFLTLTFFISFFYYYYCYYIFITI